MYRAVVALTLALATACRDAAQAPVTRTTPPASVVRGHALLTAFGDSLPANSGNGLRCTSCHLDGGMRATALPWLGTGSRYPRYRERPGREESLTERVNECIARSLAGRMLPDSSREMRDMLAYIESMRVAPRPPALLPVTDTGRVEHGARVYVRSCARCHGAAGEGGAAPAVWGAASYSIGAGMARQFTLATFVRDNMPYDRLEQLSGQDAADVAAFILTRPRQDHPGKEQDWPKGDPPPDAAYPTSAARAAGKPLPAGRPLLSRRVPPQPAVAPR